jgi:hypothetical protein
VTPVLDVSPASWIADLLLRPGRGGLVSAAVPVGYDAYIEVPLEDSPSAFWTVRDVLATATPADARCWYAIYEGWPLPPRWQEAPKFDAPDGPLLLFTGLFTDTEVIAVEFGCAVDDVGGSRAEDYPGVEDMRRRRFHEPPTLWWPESRDWVVARPVDSDCLYLAVNEQIADALITDDTLDARFVTPDTRVHED